ncbi:hypothetical protein PHET_00103 [Paragonimus heterotremus]|uniref:C-type lectin domain-containing protein n=1 Tax=Paragonimus heterotremus TaxID=100268 RepID=A0A8J4WVG3_9TREM|nr:hypothetical protein PHET_00103 [Paragonimus heterotremus]
MLLSVTITMITFAVTITETTEEQSEHSLRYIFGYKPVNYEEAVTFCSEWKGIVVKTIKPVLLDLIGYSGRPMWLNGISSRNEHHPLVFSSGGSYTWDYKRWCNVLTGYAIAARVPCDYKAIPLCQISIYGTKELQREKPMNWAQIM